MTGIYDKMVDFEGELPQETVKPKKKKPSEDEGLIEVDRRVETEKVLSARIPFAKSQDFEDRLREAQKYFLKKPTKEEAVEALIDLLKDADFNVAWIKAMQRIRQKKE